MDEMKGMRSRIEQKPNIVKIIGNTTFEIYTYFRDSGKENFTDKVVRLIKNEGTHRN